MLRCHAYCCLLCSCCLVSSHNALYFPFKREHDWLLPLWTLPSVYGIRDKMQVVLQGINMQLS